MKKLALLILVVTLLITGCSPGNNNQSKDNKSYDVADNSANKETKEKNTLSVRPQI